MNLAKLTGLCLSIIFACSSAALACSMIHIDPIELPDTTYIFTGRVVDIIGSVDFPDVIGGSSGLVIKPEGIVYAPKPPSCLSYIFSERVPLVRLRGLAPKRCQDCTRSDPESES